LNITDVDVVSILNEAVVIVRNRHHLNDDVIRMTGPGSDLQVLGDADDLRSVFVNLLDNAVKYSSPDPKVSIRAKRTALNNKVNIFIRDNGIGIPSAELKRVFRRFYRVTDDAVRSTKGSGLGLSIVRSIVEKHGGKVKADSKGEGRGTTFVVQLPLSGKV
jgi:signal transduction histidine kinase